MPDLCWTDRVPEATGYYWCRALDSHEPPLIVRVEAYASGLAAHYVGLLVPVPLRMLVRTQWAGPIRRPQEAA